MRLRSQQAHVSAARLATSAAAHNRAGWAAESDDEDTDGQPPLNTTLPYSQLPLTQHPEGHHFESQNQALTYDELQDARRITAAATRQWRSNDSRLVQLKRRWPFDPRPDRTESAVQHARRGTFDKLLHSRAVVPDATHAHGTVLPRMGPNAHDAAAASAAAAGSTSDPDSDSTDTAQQPRKRIRITPADRKREALGLPPRPLPPQGTWICINMLRTPTGAAHAEHSSRLVRCARENSAADSDCKACGAARWDGAEGQLAARVSAILQTSDIGTVTLSGVLQRLDMESGSAAGAGLQFDRADVKCEVDRQLGLRARRAHAASTQGAAEDGAVPAAAAQPAPPSEESLVAQVAAELHDSIALLAAQQSSSLEMRHRAAARALPTLPSAADTDRGQAEASAADQPQGADTEQQDAGAAAAGEDTAAPGLHELQPWPNIPDEAGDRAVEDEAVDVAGDWDLGPGLAGIPMRLQGGDEVGHEAADAAAPAEQDANPPQLRAAMQHGCNFAVTLLETILHRKCSQPSSITPLVLLHLPPDRKFMGVRVAAGVTEPSSDGEDNGATVQPAKAITHSTDAAAATLHGLTSRKLLLDERRPPLLLNAWPTGEKAAPLPAARTLPAPTLDAVLSGLPHYDSRLDELPKSWFKREAGCKAEDGTAFAQSAGAAAASGTSIPNGSYHQQHSLAAKHAAEGVSGTIDRHPGHDRSAFHATGAPGRPPPRPAHECAGWRRQPPWVPHNLNCVPKRSGVTNSTTFWYEDPAHPSRYGSLHKFRAPPGLPVSAVAQRREETLDALESQLAALPTDVRAVFAAAAEMGLPPALLSDVLRRYEALQRPQPPLQQLGQGESHKAETSSEGVSQASDTSDES